MTKQVPELKPLPGVTKPTNTRNWRYDKKVPDDLKDHPHYAGEVYAYRASLGTPDLREANSRAAAKLAELEALWRSLRAGRVQRDPSSLSPKEVHAIAQGLRLAVLVEDQRQREDLPGLVAALRLWWDAKHSSAGRAVALDAHALELDAQSLREALLSTRSEPGPGPSLPYLLSPEGAADLAQWPTWKGLPPPVRDVLVMRNLDALGRAKEAASRGDPSPFLVQAEAVAKAQGVNLGPDGWLSPAARDLRLTCQEAFLIAMEERVQRDQGRTAWTPAIDHVATPADLAAPVVVPAALVVAKTKPQRDKRQPVDILEADPAEVHLRDVWKDWSMRGRAGGKPYDPKTARIYERAVELFEKLTDDPTMARIDRVCGAQFKRAMQAEREALGISDAKLNNTLINCGTLLNHYARQTGKVPADLWSKLTDRISRQGADNSRDEWTESELRKLFGLPIWQHYSVPASKNAGLDAAYWVPLLGLFTGARITELAQALTDDLEEKSGVWFLRLAETRAEQRLKSQAAWRTIPLPQKLIDLGLIEYRTAIKATGQQWLFPGLTKGSQNGAGGGLSKWFSSLKIAQGFRSQVVFHSFRGSVNTQLIRLGFAEEFRSRYIGHQPEGGVNLTNYNKLKPEDLIPLAQRLDFPFLDLPKVYTQPAWFPGWQPRQARKKTD